MDHPPLILPSLSGLEGDRAQATSIRIRIVEQLGQATSFALLVAQENERGETPDALHQLRNDIGRALAEICEETEAKWWLNARTKTPTELLLARCPELRAFLRVAT